jgi:hypothetical protein
MNSDHRPLLGELMLVRAGRVHTGTFIASFTLAMKSSLLRTTGCS